jgi:hypothetical protein
MTEVNPVPEVITYNRHRVNWVGKSGRLYQPFCMWTPPGGNEKNEPYYYYLLLLLPTGSHMSITIQLGVFK